MKPNLTSWKWWQIDAAGAVGVGVLALVFYFGAVEPLMRNHEAYLAQRHVLEGQLEQAAKLETVLNGLRGRLEVSKQALARSPLRLKAAATINHQLADLSALAAENGLGIDDTRPDQAVPGKYFETVPISLAGSGTYRECTVFLARLRKAFPDTGVSALQMTGSAADLAGKCKFRFDLNWYTAPKSAALPKSES